MNTFATAILLLWALVAIFSPWFALQVEQIDLSYILQKPGVGYWLGADDLGRSVLDRLIAGSQASFRVSVQVVLFSLLLGTSIGSIAAWFGGWLDRALVMIMDVMMAFPGILLAIALAGILGPGLNNLILALTLVGWVGFARLSRAQVLSVKQREHVVAAQALGSGSAVIIRKHLLPLISAPLIVEATFGIAAVVIAEAGLSFLGLGIQAPDASWGSMIRDGVRYMLVAPHLVLAPGIALFLVVLSVNLLGDQLRDWMDVKIDTGKRS